MLGYFYLAIGTVMSAVGRFLKTFGSWLCKIGENKEDGI